MKFGLGIFATDYAIQLTELAPLAEARGFESLWVGEHTHIPASRITRHPNGQELPRHYWHMMDPFVGLATAAALTTNLRIGTGVCLVLEHHPIDLAKRVASLDYVSNGRFIFGISAGWNREEMENHGIEFSSRWRRMREHVEAMRAIWTMNEAEYHGEFVDFGPILAWPKPIQKPSPPIFVGGNGPNAINRVVRYGDAWMPMLSATTERVQELQRLATNAGRRPIPVTCFSVLAEPAELERLIRVGVERCVFNLPADGRDAALARIDELTRVVEPYQVD